ncbi:MAG TPA: hypothetical protein VEJ84_12925 [Acidimicrobiales bacterium]|nr:hypothetical protein [Acidimicrobiales bacterium]
MTLFAESGLSNHPFNSDFYIAIDTLMPVLLLATSVISAYFGQALDRRKSFRPTARLATGLRNLGYGLVVAYVAVTAGGMFTATAALADRNTSKAFMIVTGLFFGASAGMVSVAVLLVLTDAVAQTYTRRIEASKHSEGDPQPGSDNV